MILVCVCDVCKTLMCFSVSVLCAIVLCYLSECVL